MCIDRSHRDIGKGRRNESARGATAHEPGRKKSHRAQPQTTVLLDRDPIWLQAIEHVLKRLDIDVVGTASSPERALALLAENKPDLLIAEIDTDDPQVDGIAFLRRAKGRVPELRTIVFSTSDDREHIACAFHAGASAYVLKRTHPDDFAMAIRQLSEHSIHLAEDGVRPTPDAQGQPQLTRSEVEILQLLAEGRTNADIASTLWVSKATVKFHLGNIYRKLGVSNRTAAGRWTSAHGLLPRRDRNENHQREPEGELSV